MNRIVIIGNGFDLAHGLKTSYEDFIKWYFNEYLPEEYSKWRNVTYIASPYYTDELVQLNILTIPNYQKKKNEIHYTNVLRGRQYETFTIYDWVLNTEEGQRIIKSELLQKIVYSEKEKNWADIETEYFNLLADYANIQDETEASKKVAELNNHLQIFNNKLKDYLLYESKQKTIQLKEGICEKVYEGLTTNQSAIEKQNNIFVLNFNYTTYSDNLLPSIEYDTPMSICHIHGTLDDPTSMIFGYGYCNKKKHNVDSRIQQIDQKINGEFLYNIKSNLYSHNGNFKELLTFMDKSPEFNVLIMGHSCGESDAYILEQIFNHPNCVEIKPCYRSYEESPENERREKQLKDFQKKTANITVIMKNIEEPPLQKIATFTDCPHL